LTTAAICSAASAAFIELCVGSWLNFTRALRKQ